MNRLADMTLAYRWFRKIDMRAGDIEMVLQSDRSMAVGKNQLLAHERTLSRKILAL